MVDYTPPVDTGQPGLLAQNTASTIRSLVIASFAYAAGKGYIASDQVAPLATLAVTVGMAAWSFYKNWASTQALKAAVLAPAGAAK